MPEHVHLVVYPRERAYDISAFLSTMKQSVSKRAVLFVRRNAPGFARHMLDRQPNGRTCLRFWQRGGGYDRNLYSDQETWEKIGYIHANPVRRGFVERPEDWEWSSAADYLGVRHGPIALTWTGVPR
jgi:putative transposase